MLVALNRMYKEGQDIANCMIMMWESLGALREPFRAFSTIWGNQMQPERSVVKMFESKILLKL